MPKTGEHKPFPDRKLAKTQLFKLVNILKDPRFDALLQANESERQAKAQELYFNKGDFYNFKMFLIEAWNLGDQTGAEPLTAGNAQELTISESDVKQMIKELDFKSHDVFLGNNHAAFLHVQNKENFKEETFSDLMEEAAIIVNDITLIAHAQRKVAMVRE